MCFFSLHIYNTPILLDFFNFFFYCHWFNLVAVFNMKENFETNKNLNTDKLLGNVSSTCRRKKTSTVSINGTEPYHKPTNQQKRTVLQVLESFFLFFVLFFPLLRHPTFRVKKCVSILMHSLIHNYWNWQRVVCSSEFTHVHTHTHAHTMHPLGAAAETTSSSHPLTPSEAAQVPHRPVSVRLDGTEVTSQSDLVLVQKNPPKTPKQTTKKELSARSRLSIRK